MAFPSWVLGVILIIVGSLGNNLGNNLVSLGHKETKEQRRKESCADDVEASQSRDVSAIAPKEQQKPSGMFGMSWRVSGTIIFVLGNLFTFASFGFGAQSLLASLESIQFVSNLVFAKYCHNEKVTIRMLLATLSIVVGNVLVVIFAEHSAVLYHSTGMIHLYVVNTAYHGYLIAAFCIFVISGYAYLHYYNSRVKLRKLLWRHNFMEPFCYAVSSAIVGTQAVLNSKCMSMLIQVTLRGEKNEFEDWYIYFILATWIIMVAFWLNRLDRGLELFPPLFIIPVMQVFFVFFAILCGGIYFEEFTMFSTSQYIGFVFGVSMILGGVYGLAPTDMVLHTPDEVVVPVISANSSAKEGKKDGYQDLESGGEGDGELLEMAQFKEKERPVTSQSEDRSLDSVAAPVMRPKPLVATADGETGPLHPGEEVPLFTSQSSLLPDSPKVGSHKIQLAPIDPSLTPSVGSKKNRKVVKRSFAEGAGGASTPVVAAAAEVVA